MHINDKDDVALGRGLRYVKDVLDERVRRGSITSLQRDRTFARLAGTTDYSGLGTADLAIEAVFEDLALKHGVLGEIEARVKDTCVIASNTSSLPITLIAEASKHPERILGMHYFSPVHRMQLLEVVRTKHTDPRAIATAVAMGRRQGKTVIVVHDGTASTRRASWCRSLNEAVQMLTEGVSVDTIDRALVDWGFPTGPLHHLDELGIDVASHVATVLESAFGDRLHAPRPSLRSAATTARARRTGAASTSTARARSASTTRSTSASASSRSRAPCPTRSACAARWRW